MTGQTRKFWPPRDKTAPQGDFRPCDHPGCTQCGEYRAPKSRDALTDYYWFCLDHVRQYNLAWDYYAGLRPEEIERMVRLDTTWQRPTWPLGTMSGGRWRLDPERVKDGFGFFEDDMAPPSRERRPPPAEEQALALMGLGTPLTVEALKARYKDLCKQHHPDANNGDKAAEERFKQIGQAYQILLDALAD